LLTPSIRDGGFEELPEIDKQLKILDEKIGKLKKQ